MKIELHLSVQNTTLTPKEMREFILRQEWPMAWEHKFNLFQMACPREVVAWVFVVLEQRTKNQSMHSLLGPSGTQVTAKQEKL